MRILDQKEVARWLQQNLKKQILPNRAQRRAAQRRGFLGRNGRPTWLGH